MATSTLIASVSSVIEEVLQRGVETSLPDLDPLMREVATSWMGVSRDGIGRDWKKIWNFSESISGAFLWTPPDGAPTGDSDFLTHSTYPADTLSFPTLADTVTPGYLSKTIQLVRGMGNMFVPFDFIRADKLDAVTTSLIADIAAGAAKNVALAECGAWYTHDAYRSHGVCAGAYLSTTTNKATFVIKGGQVRQFANGQHVEFYDATDSYARLGSSKDIVVDSVSYVPDMTNDSGGYGQVTFAIKDGTTWNDGAGFGTAVAAGDVIVLKDQWDASNTRSYGPAAPEQWLIDSGNIVPFSLNVDTYEQFKSIVHSVSGVLTEKVLNQVFGRFFKAYGYADMPDCLVMSMGTNLSYLENKTLSAPGFRINRDQSERATIQDGFEMGETPYVFNGRPVKWKVSAFMPSLSDATNSATNGGRVWALKVRDQNLQRLVPPPLTGSKTLSQFGREIEFVLPQTGPMGVFKAHHNTVGGTTNYLEAPFECYRQHVAKVVQGIKLTGVSEVL